jgi:hypothetical protein
MAATDPSPLAAYPPELIAYVADQAERDALRVVQFISDLRESADEEIRLPGQVLLDLGAALCLRAWEEAGLTLHREAGLPSADDAIKDALTLGGSTAAPYPLDASLGVNVVLVSIESFAWTGASYLQAEILLDTPDEDDLVEALAHFLWARRHAPPGDE